MNYRDIITIEPEKRGGKPCVRGLRITVYEVLEYLASDGEWRFIPYSEGDTIELMSLGITLSLNAIYEDVVLELEDEGGEKR